MLRRGAYLGLLLVLTACTALQEHGKKRRFQLAQKDHTSCTARGFEFPSAKYRKCRLAEMDERDRKLWMEVQMSQRSNEPNTAEFIIPNTPNRIEEYRSIDDEHFLCELRYYDDIEYVYCDTH